MERIQISRPSDWEKLGIENPEFLTSAGSFGCVFSGTYKGRKVLLKFVFVDEKENPSIHTDVGREAFISHFLATAPPPEIASMFAGTRVLIHSDKISHIPDAWIALMDQRCKDREVNETYLLIQDYVEGTSLLSWIASKTTEISGDIIRSVLFQIVLGLAYVQHAYGFQHNDVKPDNFMCVELLAPKTKTFLLDGSDVFEITIPAGGVEIVFIDFGASALITATNQSTMSELLRTDAIRTPEFVPFDKFGYPELALARKNDADTTGIFMVALSMVAHQRFVTGSTVWTAKSNFVRSIYETFTDKAKQALVKSVGMDNEDETKESVGLLAMYVAIADALNIDLGKDKKVPKGAVGTLIRVALNKDNKAALLKVIPYDMRQLAGLIDDVFGGGGEGRVALQFMSRLFAPWESQRQSFGIPEPFNKYCLANALYHSFFAYPYWKQNVAPRGISLGRIGAPLIYTDERNVKGVHADITKRVEAFEKSAPKPVVMVVPPPTAPVPAKPVVVPSSPKAAPKTVVDDNDMQQCFGEMRAYADDIDRIKIKDSDLIKAFQRCINIIAANVDSTDTAAVDILKSLNILDASGKAATVTSVKGASGFNFEPARGYFITEEVAANAAFILLGFYVMLKLQGWAATVPALKAQLDAKDAAGNYLVNTKNIANWVTKNLGALFVAKTREEETSVEEEEEEEATPEDEPVINNQVSGSIMEELRHFANVYNVKTIPATLTVSEMRGTFTAHMHRFAEIIDKELDNAAYKLLLESWPASGDSLEYGWADAISKGTGRQRVRESFLIMKAKGKGVEEEVIEPDAEAKGLGYNIGPRGEFSTMQIYSQMTGHVLFLLAALNATKGGEFPFPPTLVKVIKGAATFTKGKNKDQVRPLADQAKTYRGVLDKLGELYHVTAVAPIKSQIQTIQQQLEIVETIKEYKIGAGYDMAQIQTALIDPLRSIVCSTPIDTELHSIFDNLGLIAAQGDGLNVPAGMETKYLHALSLAAQLLESQESEELVARIQAEWPIDLIEQPPLATVKKGSVFQV